MLGYAPSSPLPRHRMNRSPTHTLPLRLATASALLSAAGATAALAEIAWNADGVHEQAFSVGPAGAHEVCGRIDAGTRIRWRFESDAPADFNIHHHVGPQVIFAAKEEGSRRAEGRFEAKETHDYCWMWSRKAGAAAAVRLRLERER